MAPRLVCLSAYRPGHLPPTLYHRNETEEVFREMLLSGLPIVWYNAAFDLTVLLANFPRLTKMIFEAYQTDRVVCCLVRESLHLLALGELGRQRGALSMAGTYLRRTGRILPKDEDVRFHFGELEHLPVTEWPQAAREYALKDAVVPSELYLQQEDLPDEQNQTRAAFALNLMAATGIRADGAKVHALREKLEARILAASRTLVPAGFVRPAGSRDMKAIKAAVALRYEDMKLPPPYAKQKESRKAQAEREARGKEKAPPSISTAEETLKIIPCAGGRQCDEDKFVTCDEPLHVLLYRNKDAKEKSSYLPHLEMACRTPINYRVTFLLDTGRTGKSEPPVDQLPRRTGVRQCVVPPEGMVFVGADYSAVELVAISQVFLDMFGASVLADTINADMDPHARTGSMLMGVGYDDFVTRRKAEEKLPEPPSRGAVFFRQFSKALAFGVLGGLGAETFLDYLLQYNIRLEGTREEQVARSRQYIRDFKDWYPEVKRYLNVISEQCGQHGGRFTMAQPRSGRIRGDVGFTDGANSPMQGLAADLAKDAVWTSTRESFVVPSSPLFGFRLTLFPHDELIFQGPEEVAPEAGDRLSELMVEAGRRWCPDVKVKAEPWISRWWDKKAKTCRDENGRLLVWMP